MKDLGKLLGVFFVLLTAVTDANARLCRCEPAGFKGCNASNTCQVANDGFCYVYKELINEEDHYELGCMKPHALQCLAQDMKHQDPKAMECCSNGDFCNDELEPTYHPDHFRTDEGSGGMSQLQIGLLVGLAVILLVSLTLLTLYITKRKDWRKKQRTDSPLLDATLSQLEQSQSSGSGSGYPVLVPCTIARQIQLLHTVGKGRYGEVWKGCWRGESVAVKIFVTTEEASWAREKELYETVMLRHENILGFIASDIKGTGWTEMWLISEFHEYGSLHDYLQQHVLSTARALRQQHSIACGLAHLHAEVSGTRGKPAIAHRDIKSKNILVKRDGTCCIADLGLAVKYIRERNEIDIAPNTRQGTKRYMAPEILDDSIVRRRFDSYKMADMYACGLVLWEITNRIEIDGVPGAYQIPYEQDVPPDPSFEQMRKLVCDDGHRPPLDERWHQQLTLRQVSCVMRECWSASPGARLSSLRVQKSLAKLQRALTGGDEPDYKPPPPPLSRDASSAFTGSSAYTCSSAFSDVTRSSLM